MKHTKLGILIATLLIGLLSIQVSVAQNTSEQLPETYCTLDNVLSVSYPSGWNINDSLGAAYKSYYLLSSEETSKRVEKSRNGLADVELTPDDIWLNWSYTEATNIPGSTDDPLVGLKAASLHSSDSVGYSEPQVVQIGNHQVAMAELTPKLGQTWDAVVYGLTINDQFMVIYAATGLDEYDTHRPLIESIIASIQKASNCSPVQNTGEVVNPIAYGDSLTGELNEGDSVRYRFTGKKGDLITIKAESTDFNLTVMVTQEGGQTISVKSNYAEPIAQIVSLPLPDDDTYIIRITSTTSGGTGNFTLVLTVSDSQPQALVTVFPSSTNLPPAATATFTPSISPTPSMTPTTTPTPTKTPTLTPTPSIRTYTDVDGNFTFDYPTAWSIGSTEAEIFLNHTSIPGVIGFNLIIGIPTLVSDFGHNGKQMLPEKLSPANGISKSLDYFLDTSTLLSKPFANSIEEITIGNYPVAILKVLHNSKITFQVMIDLGNNIPAFMQVDTKEDGDLPDTIIALIKSINITNVRAYQVMSSSPTATLQLTDFPATLTPTPILIPTILLTLSSSVPTLQPLPIPSDATASPPDTLAPQVVAVVSTSEEGLVIRTGAGTNFQMVETLESGATVTILEGPVATGDMNWWRISVTDGKEGWVAIATDDTITLRPTSAGLNDVTPSAPEASPTETMVPTPVSCPGLLPSQMIKGAQGQVLPGQPNNIRQKPTRSGKKLMQMPGGSVFDVLDGPVCADGYAWWQINYNGVIGWTAESGDGAYWIAPVDDNVF